MESEISHLSKYDPSELFRKVSDNILQPICYLYVFVCLDDIIMSTCSCIFGEDEPASPHPGDRREVKSAQPHAKKAGRKAKVMKAGTTVDGTPLLIENTSLGIFGLVPHFGHQHG